MTAVAQGDLVAVARRKAAGWVAELHDDRGVFVSIGSHPSRAGALARADVERERITARAADLDQLVALRLARPLRSDGGRAIERQDDASACPLFAAAGQGALL